MRSDLSGRTRGAILLSMVFMLVAGPPSEAAEKRAWELEQINTYAPTGQWNVILADQGIRAGDGTFALVFPAPNFDAIMENSKTKQYAFLSNNEWVRTFVKGGTTWKDEARSNHYIKPGTQTGHIAGFNVKQYFLYEREKNHPIREIWTTTDIKLAKKNLTVLNQLCDAPSCDGVPLRVVELHGDGKKKVLLNTLEAKQVPVVSSAFATPKGYKREKSTTALMLTVGQGKEFSDMLTESDHR